VKGVSAKVKNLRSCFNKRGFEARLSFRCLRFWSNLLVHFHKQRVIHYHGFLVTSKGLI
jgi:hypothetical protein